MRPWTGPADALSDRIAAFVRAALADTPTEPFERLALDVHRWQAAHAPVIAALVDGPVDRWQAIPAVPVALYKDLPVGTVARDEPCVAFVTSGTTGGGQGVHRLRSTALYDLGAIGWARTVLPATPGEVVAALLDPSQAPGSSLSHMVASFTRFERPPGTATWHLAADGSLDGPGLIARVAGLTRPVFFAATAFALAEWLEEHDPPALPVGSVLMVTGGFKGRVHRLDDAALYRLARTRLRPAALVTEYGMTELSSQLWGTPESAYRPPPWLRVLAVDPVSGTPRPSGEVGQLRFYDLCNLDASIGVETLDEGVVHLDGSVSLRGRLSGAPARGCSLTVEEAWARR